MSGIRKFKETRTESYTGSDCTGSNLATNRVLTLSNPRLTKYIQVAAGGMTLTEDTDYTVSHLAASTTVTFLGQIANAQKLEVLYST